MDMHIGREQQPCLNQCGFVATHVVADHMDLLILSMIGHDVFQKTHELRAGVTRARVAAFRPITLAALASKSGSSQTMWVSSRCGRTPCVIRISTRRAPVTHNNTQRALRANAALPVCLRITLRNAAISCSFSFNGVMPPHIEIEATQLTSVIQSTRAVLGHDSWS